MLLDADNTHTFLFVCAMWLLFEFTALDTVGFTEGHSTSCVKHDSCVLTKSCRNRFTAKHNKLRQFWVQMAIDRSVGCLQTTCMALSAAKDDEVKADPSLGWPRVQPSSKCIDFISLAKAAAAWYWRWYKWIIAVYWHWCAVCSQVSKNSSSFGDTFGVRTRAVESDFRKSNKSRMLKSF